MSKPTFWLKDNRYFMLTGDDWQGCVYVALSGETPDTVCELGMTKSQMEGAKEVKPWAVPFEWWRAFSKLCDEIPPNPPAKPEPEPKPKPKPKPKPRQAAAEEELLMHVAAGTDPLTAGLAAADGGLNRGAINGPDPVSFFAGVFVAVLFIVVALML